jgi:hypothetical protein
MDGGMADETRAPLLDAALALGQALAVEARLPEPGGVAEITLPPLAAAWGKHAGTVQDFQTKPGADNGPVLRAVEELLGSRA